MIVALLVLSTILFIISLLSLKGCQDYIICLIAFLVLSYAIYMFLTGLTTPTPESFENAPANAADDEDITPFSSGLTVYLSAFSKASYDPVVSGRKWRNLAPHFEGSTCPILPGALDFNFMYNPSFSKENGFYLGNNVLHGPMSFQCGVSTNESLSVFMTLKFATFSRTSTEDIDIFRMYANTINNTGLALVIKKDYVMENDLVKCNMVLEFGEKRFPVEMPAINTAHTYIFMIVKNSLRLDVHIYPNVTDLSSTSSLRTHGLHRDLEVGTDVLLSNKEVVLNSNKNAAVHLFNIGFYNRAIPEYYMNDLYNHIQKHLQKTNAMLQGFATQIGGLEKEITDLRACPYDDETCNICGSVTDWSDTTHLLTHATSDCLSQVHRFCKANPNHPKCVCWNPTNVQSKTEACMTYVSIFDSETRNKLRLLQELQLQQINDKLTTSEETTPVQCADKMDQYEAMRTFNLCPCTVRDMSVSDLELYNAIPIPLNPAI